MSESFTNISEGLALTLGLYILAGCAQYGQKMADKEGGDPAYLRSLAVAWLVNTMNKELDGDAPLSEEMKAFEDLFQEIADKNEATKDQAVSGYLGRCLGEAMMAATKLLEQKEKEDE